MNTDKLLKLSIKYLLVASLFIPLVFFKSFFFPFVTGKALVFRLLVEVGFILFAVYWIRNKKINFNLSFVWWSFLALVAAIFLSAVFGVNYYNSFWSNMERAEGVLFWIHYLVYFSLLSVFFTTRKDFSLLFRSSLIVALVVFIYGFMQSFGLFGAITTTGSRMSSTLGNPAYLASYALINLFLALYLLIIDKNIYWRVFYVIFSVTSFVVIFMTQTRGAILGLLGGLVLTSLLTVLKTKNKIIKNVSLGVVVLAVVFLTSVFIFKDSSIIKNVNSLNRIASISFEDYTTKTRLVAWRAAFEGFKDKPVFGWGLENYSPAFSSHFPPEIYTETDSQLWFDKAHSVLFEYLVTTGLVGTIAYLALLIFLIFYLWKNKTLSPLEKNLFIGLLFGYTFANMFVFDTISTYILFAVVAVFVSNSYFWNQEGNTKNILLSKWSMLVLVIIGLFFVYTGAIANVLASTSNHKILKAEATGSIGVGEVIKEALPLYLDALNNNNNLTRFEARRFFTLYVINKSDNFENYEVAKMYEQAISETEKSIAEDPNDIKNYYNLSQLYLKSYEFDRSRLNKVIDMGDKMISLGESRAHTYYQIAEAYYRLNDYNNALKYYQKAQEINPNVVDTHVNIFVLSVVMKNSGLEAETVEKIKSLSPDFFETEDHILRFLPLFKKVNRTDRVISDLQKLIVLNPNKIEYISSLALEYAAIGDNKKSEETIRTLLGIESELDIKVNEFIDKLNKGELKAK